jgi:Lon protease-like protein
VADVIPLFPLSHVLMPAMPLPLHIFEPRYRQLLADVQRGPGTAAFGVVGLRGGVEVQAGNTPSVAAPPIAAVGTLAEILEVEAYEDGASDLLTVGSRRFRIRRLISDTAPYLQAEVEWLEEVDGELRPQQVTATRRLCREYAALLEELTGRHRESELPRDAALLSYHVAGELPLAPEDRQELLEKATAAERLERAVRLLGRELALLRATRSICVAPSVLQLVANPN